MYELYRIMFAQKLKIIERIKLMFYATIPFNQV